MANWYGKARSNYFYVKDEGAFLEALGEMIYDLDIVHDHAQRVGLLAKTEDGDWPTLDTQDVPDIVAEHLVPGEVAVFMSAGAEKLRCVTGYAEAVTSEGKRVSVSLQDIYAKAAEAFDVPVDKIPLAER